VDLEERRRSLEERLAELVDRVGRMESTLRDPGSKDWQERATEVENDEVLERLSEAERGEIAAIRTALARIRDGSYSVCARCGGEIAPRRLEALPDTSLCVGCAR
jgi:RNA polymerase-binding transcription factor DksA